MRHWDGWGWKRFRDRELQAALGWSRAQVWVGQPNQGADL